MSTAPSRTLVIDAAAIAAGHMLVAIAARQLGFDHVSDDDFARVTIAQTFAQAPKLDPSGTSWLPFPFWALGASMVALGRSLAVACGVSIVLTSAAATLPYLAVRLIGAPRARSLVATAFAFGTPWAIWLGATTVPESFTASLTVSAAIVLGVKEGPSQRARFAFALALLAACLSRYEPWPVAALLVIVMALRARRDASARRVWIVCTVIAVIGPLLWMAWNAHAHDGPLHFFRRVSNFKRAIGEGSTSTVEALFEYPLLLFLRRPELLIYAFPTLFILRDSEVRRRWGVPLLAALAQLVFLGVGNTRDGAPAHHPERALLGVMLILALFTIDASTEARARVPHHMAMRKHVLTGAFFVFWPISFVFGITSPPGNSPSDDRRAQIERGMKLREEGVVSVVVTPCAFEHFALLAAYGSPERAVLHPKTDAPLTPECPMVEGK